MSTHYTLNMSKRFNISIPDAYLEQWEEIEQHSKWIQDKLDEERIKSIKEQSDDTEE